MRCLGLVILVLMCGLNTSVFAQICCPAGCVNDYNPARCVTTGPNPRTCNSVPCGGSSQGSRGGSSGTGSGVIYQPPPCTFWYQTQPARDAAASQCVAALTANAQFWGCLFEDNAGRAEDQRTGLSCADRQAALARQCQARCARYAQSMTTCSGGADGGWQRSFGDIGGSTFGSARVDLCGPRLRSSFFNRAGRSGPQRFQP
jgi:hypothetical protein